MRTAYVFRPLVQARRPVRAQREEVRRVGGHLEGRHRALALAGEEERVGVGVVVRDDDGGRLVEGDRVQQREVLAPVHHHLPLRLPAMSRRYSIKDNNYISRIKSCRTTPDTKILLTKGILGTELLTP